MATNEILRFAETNTGTNLLTQAEYLADSQRPIGNQPGVARSKLVNKALRQASLIAAGLAEYIADNQANNITDALTPQNIADYLQAALTGALGVTPPQFDNDTSLATTAFVQSALGNLSTCKSIGASQALTAADAGKLIHFSTGGAHTVTLPGTSIVPDGTSFTFVNTGASPGTIQRAGADVISTNGVFINSFSLGVGDFAVLVKYSTVWMLFGSVSLPDSPLFAKSFAINGYQKLPGGLIIQWALSPPIPASSNAGVTLPISFLTGVLSVSATFADTAMNRTPNTVQTCQVMTWSTNSVTLRNLSLEQNQYFVIAIGR